MNYVCQLFCSFEVQTFAKFEMISIFDIAKMKITGHDWLNHVRSLKLIKNKGRAQNSC